MKAAYGFQLNQEYAAFLDHLGADLSTTQRRYVEWAERAGLSIPREMMEAQADLLTNWTSAILVQQNKLQYESTAR